MKTFFTILGTIFATILGIFALSRKEEKLPPVESPKELTVEKEKTKSEIEEIDKKREEIKKNGAGDKTMEDELKYWQNQ